MEAVKGTHTARKGATEEFFEGLPSEEEALAVTLGAYGLDSKKENQDVGEGSSYGILRPIISSLSPQPIPIPPPRKKPSVIALATSMAYTQLFPFSYPFLPFSYPFLPFSYPF